MKSAVSLKMAVIAAGVAFVSSVTGYLFGVKADNRPMRENAPVPQTENVQPLKEVVEASEESETVVKEPVTKKYVLKENGGSLTLYLVNSDGTEKEYKTYDININTLPSVDREKLTKGIEAESLSEALMMVEDYF